MATMNPFLIVGYNGPEYFCDREAETQTLISALVNGRNVTLISPRRMGKTGLIKNVFYRLSQSKESTVCIYLDIFSTQSLQDFVYMLGKAVLGRFDTFSQKAIKSLMSFFKSCRPIISVDEASGTPTVSLDFVPERSSETLKEIFEYLSKSEHECFIAIDEFQQITEYPEKGVEGLLRSYIQFLPNVHFIFSGSKRHLMETIFFSAKRPFYQSTQKMFLTTISKDSYFKFAQNLFAEAGKELDKKVFESVYNKVSGHTWYVQYILNRMYSLTIQSPTSADLNSVMENIIKEEEYLYQTYFDLLTAGQIRLLTAIAKEGKVTEINSSAFIKKYNLKAASSVNAALKSLKEKDFILKDTKGYSVSDRFFALWLKGLP